MKALFFRTKFQLWTEVKVSKTAKLGATGTRPLCTCAIAKKLNSLKRHISILLKITTLIGQFIIVYGREWDVFQLFSLCYNFHFFSTAERHYFHLYPHFRNIIQHYSIWCYVLQDNIFPSIYAKNWLTVMNESAYMLKTWTGATQFFNSQVFYFAWFLNATCL